MADDDMDDLEWEAWLELTEEQQDAIVDREMAAYQRRLDAMTLRQQVAHHRDYVLESIRQNRHRLRDSTLHRIEIIDQIWRESIQHSQLRLLKLRIWRATGNYPGQG